MYTDWQTGCSGPVTSQQHALYCRRYPSFRERLPTALKANPGMGRDPLCSQQESIITDLFEATCISTPSIIDTLNECKDIKPASAILFILSHCVDDTPEIKFFIAGCTEPRIRSGFRLVAPPHNGSVQTPRCRTPPTPWWTMILSYSLGLGQPTSPKRKAAATSRRNDRTRMASIFSARSPVYPRSRHTIEAGYVHTYRIEATAHSQIASRVQY